MTDVLAQRLGHLQIDFLAAIGNGPAAVSSFNRRYAELLQELAFAAERGTLSQHTRELARTVSTTIIDLASNVSAYDARFDELALSSASSSQSETEAQPPSSSVAVPAPLFQYFLHNICHPYPDPREKDQVVEEMRCLGWVDYDRKKFEEWLNRKRHQSGFVAILHRHCNNDREAMRSMCRRALYGSDEEKARLSQDAVDEIEDMRDLVQSQLDELTEEKESIWVDNLSSCIEAALHHSRASESPALESTSSDDEPFSDSDSDTMSDYSDTDVEDDEDEALPCPIIGAKRKLTDCGDCASPLAGRLISRSLSMTSASSSLTACSFRSLSEASISKASSVDWEDGDTNDRPAKRGRHEESCSDAESDPYPNSPEGASPADSLSTNPLFTTYQTKRKRVGSDMYSRTRSMKRSRYAALGVTSQTSGVSRTHFSTLSDICSLDWVPVEVVASDLEVESFAVDGTHPADDESGDEDIEIFEDEPADGVLTWSRLQINIILRILLSSSDQALHSSLAQSTSYAFDVDSLDVANAVDLQEMMELTPEALSAMFDAMNGLVPAAQQTAVPAERTAVTSETALLSPDAPIATQAILDVPALALDVPTPALVAPSIALDVSKLAVDTPASPAALDGPTSADGEPLSPSEESDCPISSSSSDSDGDSPPALSEDSRSSSRSSSVESDSEQDSLLLSPTILSADYSRLTDELSARKATNADPSQFHVEFGAVCGVASVDESSCASELLERYLNDQMTWA